MCEDDACDATRRLQSFSAGFESSFFSVRFRPFNTTHSKKSKQIQGAVPGASGCGTKLTVVAAGCRFYQISLLDDLIMSERR